MELAAFNISATNSGLRRASARVLTATTGWTTPAGSPSPNATFESQLVTITNNFRGTKSARACLLNATLGAISVWKSDDMAVHGYLDHDQPTGSSKAGTTVSDRFAAFGFTGAWGENIAYGFVDPQSVFNAFISAGPGEGHYDNIVNPAWTHIGIGCVASPASGLLFWTMDFGIAAVGATPTISGVSPTTLSIGNTLTITGTNFTDVQEIDFSPASSGKMVSSQFTVVSATKITATVPEGAGSGEVAVITLGGTAFSSSITIGSAPPPPPPPPPSPTKPQVGQTWALKTNAKTHVQITAVTTKKITFENLKNGNVKSVVVATFLADYALVG